MSNVKLSQITSGGAFVAATDNIVTVRNGNTDVLTTITNPSANVNSVSGDGTIISNSGSTGAVTLTLANTPTGTGGVVLANSPTLVTPALGTPASGTLTNCGGTASSLTAGHVTNATFTTALTVNTGTLTLTANAANTSVLTIGAGAVSVSGSNTGDQTITLTGAVTGSGTGSFATTIATPGTLTVSSTNSTATAHTHAITSSSAPGAAASILATDSSGIIGSTGTRIVKGWFTDLTVTNAIAGSTTGNAVLGANTFTGEQSFPAATSGAPSFHIASSAGTNVSAPSSGDTWWNGTNLYFYNGSSNIDLLSAAVTAKGIVGGSVYNGSGLATGQFPAYVTCPYAGTIAAWNIQVDAGTCTVKVWKVATGTAAPTSANSINTSGVSLSTGTAVRSTTLTDFTTTTVTAGDIFGFDLTAVATATIVSFQLEITKA